jgi:hypothetical protein
MSTDPVVLHTDQDKQEHLFTLRLWRETVEEGQSEWRGRLYHAATGEVRHFRAWSSLIPLLLAMMQDASQKPR